jgi:hypothetical protein
VLRPDSSLTGSHLYDYFLNVLISASSCVVITSLETFLTCLGCSNMLYFLSLILDFGAKISSFVLHQDLSMNIELARCSNVHNVSENQATEQYCSHQPPLHAANIDMYHSRSHLVLCFNEEPFFSGFFSVPSTSSMTRF